MKEQIQHIQMIDFGKFNNFQRAYKILNAYANDEVKVTFRLNYEKEYPFNNVSSIIIRGKVLEFHRCDWLVTASKLADNISVTPYLDGTFDYCLTFCNSLITIYKEGLN